MAATTALCCRGSGMGAMPRRCQESKERPYTPRLEERQPQGKGLDKEEDKDKVGDEDAVGARTRPGVILQPPDVGTAQGTRAEEWRTSQHARVAHPCALAAPMGGGKLMSGLRCNGTVSRSRPSSLGGGDDLLL